jgi:hypothetical protein
MQAASELFYGVSIAVYNLGRELFCLSPTEFFGITGGRPSPFPLKKIRSVLWRISLVNPYEAVRAGASLSSSIVHSLAASGG